MPRDGRETQKREARIELRGCVRNLKKKRGKGNGDGDVLEKRGEKGAVPPPPVACEGSAREALGSCCCCCCCCY